MTKSGKPQVGDIWHVTKGRFRVTKVTQKYAYGNLSKGVHGRFGNRSYRFLTEAIAGGTCAKSVA